MGLQKQAQDMKPSKVFSLMTGMIILMLPASNAQGQTFTGPELLARPTDHSMTLNVVSSSALDAYIEYGTSSGVYTSKTDTVSQAANKPIVIVIDGLSANIKYYYRLRYRVSGGGTFSARAEHTFQTQRPPGSTFTFTIISDSHMNGGGGNATLYQQTLDSVLTEHPDFHFDLGDTFWMDGVTDSTIANQRYLQQRVYMGTVSHSVPIFVAPGNHDQEEAWHLDDTGNPATSPPVLGANARKKYFPNPVPDAFYSGNTDPYSYLHGDHLREDYYVWTWGDALFVVIDPYWYTTTKPFIGNAGGGESHDVGSGDRWDWTLGLQQFNWLKQTLQNSNARFKFVFDHHPVGGAEDYVRGGAGPANLVEWGGYDEDGTTWGFNTRRSGWGNTPIHQLMVANGVTAYFHGHDHLYAYEVRDGLVYQEVPSAGLTGSGLSSYYSNPYVIKVLPSPGHLRVTVSPTQTTVDFVPTNTGQLNYSYTILAPSITVNTKIFLEGPYSGGSMSTALRTGGYIPTGQPYSTSPWNYTGTESVGSIPTGIVDWVLVELRSNATTTVGTRAAFVKSDGSVVDTNGVSPVAFVGLSAGNYYIVMRHRNHLAIMSAATWALSGSSSLYDFTTAQSQAYTTGPNPMVALPGGTFGMVAGDASPSGLINASDRLVVKNNTGASGYNIGDVNLSGLVNATDRLMVKNNTGLGSQVP